LLLKRLIKTKAQNLLRCIIKKNKIKVEKFTPLLFKKKKKNYKLQQLGFLTIFFSSQKAKGNNKKSSRFSRKDYL
jgi:hypothetical protein